MECIVDGCYWRLYASVLPDKKIFIVKTINPKHNCNKTDCNENLNTNIT